MKGRESGAFGLAEMRTSGPFGNSAGAGIAAEMPFSKRKSRRSKLNKVDV